MLQVRGDADFAQEPFGAQRGGHFGMEDLEGDRPIVLEVVSEEHRRHTATSHLTLEPVGAGESILEQPAEVGHGCPL